MKKLISLLLACAFLFVLPAAAYATTANLDNATDQGNLVLNGKVSATATLVSVTIPTKIDYEIIVDSTESLFTSLVSGSGTMTNNLTTPAYVTLASVSESSSVATGILDVADFTINLKAGVTSVKMNYISPLVFKEAFLANPLSSGSPLTVTVTGSGATADFSDLVGETSTIITVLKVYGTAPTLLP